MSSTVWQHRLLIVYPRPWRERYGEEFAAVLEAEGERGGLGLAPTLDLIGAGLVERLRSTGLVGEELPPSVRIRSGLLAVLCAWAVFVVAGSWFSKIAEHWNAATPRPERLLPSVAFHVLSVGAVLGAVCVVAGVLLVLRPIVSALRRGGWQAVRAPLLAALASSGLTVAAAAPVIGWAHRLTSLQRNGGDWHYSGAFMLIVVLGITSIGLWTRAAVVMAGRLVLPALTLRRETLLAAAVTVAMAGMTVAAVIWWVAVEAAAPGFFGSGVPVFMIFDTLGMVLASLLALAGLARALRAGGSTSAPA